MPSSNSVRISPVRNEGRTCLVDNVYECLCIDHGETVDRFGAILIRKDLVHYKREVLRRIRLSDQEFTGYDVAVEIFESRNDLGSKRVL